MNIDIDIKNIEDFVKSDNFISFLQNKTTNFSTAAFILQTLLDKIDEIKKLIKEQEYKNRNSEKTGKWEINPDGYYPQCPFCGQEPPNGKEEICPSCGASLE